jgi:filamentous hemagglutinin family protein
MALLSGGPWVGAQVVLDGSLGASGALTGPHFGIDAAAGSIRGDNLFHSFSQFDLQTGDSATFTGPANIQNILGRVTGGVPSQIDGAIRSGIAGANLFLINPGGILFGPNASVDVSGSFAASSAHYLKLADGAHFVAALDADDSVLTTGPVVAFGFLEGASGSVEVRGQWVAGQGGNLEVVGSLVSVSEGTRLEAERWVRCRWRRCPV